MHGSLSGLDGLGSARKQVRARGDGLGGQSSYGRSREDSAIGGSRIGGSRIGGRGGAESTSKLMDPQQREMRLKER